MDLVEISPTARAIDVDLRYATPDNLTGRPLYGKARCFLRPPAAAALAEAARLAGAAGLRVRIFDAFRPAAAQKLLWRALPDPRYIADPAKGSNHTRGVAVDLTLADEAGRPLDMGTAFDDMTPRSHRGATDLEVGAQRHRFLLTGLMAAAGWESYPFEWWHYQLPDAAAFPLIDDAEAPAGLLPALADAR
jgi:D-alanyl-D-alanine dipeptidase